MDSQRLPRDQDDRLATRHASFRQDGTVRSSVIPTGAEGDGHAMTTTVPAPTLDRVAEVIAAAKQAWEVHGERVAVGETPVNGHARLTSLAAPTSRRVEYVVECDDPDVWEVLATAKAADDWQLCALVPLALMGTAHERLCDHGFELQGWWLQGDRVAFGGVEIA